MTDAKPLIHAIEHGDVEAARKLLMAHPNMATGDDGEGWTPLLSACRLRDVELVQTLIQLGANVNARNNINPQSGEGDNFPLWFAANQKKPGRVEVAKILVRHGAQVNAVGEFGETPLHQAASWNNADIAEYLIGAGANVNAEILPGKTPLILALKFNFDEVARVLREGGAR